MPRSAKATFALIVLLGLLVQPELSQAGIDAEGNVEPNPETTTWTTSTTGYVGKTANGSLWVNDAYELFSSTAYLGYNSGVSGEVTVTDPDSIWTNKYDLYVGYHGNGTLAIRNGGTVTNSSCDIGYYDEAVGHVIVEGSESTWTNTSSLSIGSGGNGTLTISGGGSVQSGSGDLGDSWDSYGEVTVTGTGSTWNNSGNIHVGHLGCGTLAIHNGGAVTVAGETQVAYFGDSTGTIEFDNGSLSTTSLLASPSQLVGTGTITTQGLVSDVDLEFDTAASLIRTLHFSTQPGDDVSVTLDLTDPNHVGALGAGYQGAGSLTIRNGLAVYSGSGYLGRKSGSTGTATIEGPGSAWNINGSVSIGRGTLYLTEGGVVNVGGTTSLSSNTISPGMIIFGPGGGTLTTRSLSFISPSQFTGEGTINTRGLVSDISLVFDSEESLIQTFRFQDGMDQNVILNLDMSDPSNVGSLGVGRQVDGMITIRNGVTVKSDLGYLGYGSEGSAIVNGPGSTWNCIFDLRIGEIGHGKLLVANGGCVNSSICRIGESSYSSGEVTITGHGSTLNSSWYLYVGNNGDGVLTVENGGTIDTDTAYVAKSGGFNDSTGKVLVTGLGSTWANQYSLAIGGTMGGHGMFTITDGGAVSASIIGISSGIYSNSVLAMEVNEGSRLTARSISNNGTVRIMAGTAPAPGAKYSPISATTWLGTGVYQALGGTWNTTTHEFTASTVASGTPGTPITIDLSGVQRAFVDDPATGWSVGASFLAKTGAPLLEFTATPLGTETLADLDALLDENETIRSAWEFTATGGYVSGEPAYLSLSVIPGDVRNRLTVWHYDGADWTEFDAWDLTCDGMHASFTITEWSGYAVTATLIPGDTNGDNWVDTADAATLADHWGEAGEWSDGDFNGDGIVNAADASLLAANWHPSPPIDEALFPNSVPEPGSIALLLSLGVLVATRRGNHTQ